MEFDLSSFTTPFVIVAIVLTVLFSEIAKKLDKKDVLKGYRVILPLCFSLFFTILLWVAESFTLRQAPLYWFAIFGVSVFGYESIIKRIGKKINTDESDKEIEEAEGK